MAQILVRGLDSDVVDRLKQRAQSSGRTLQAEVKGILERAAKADYKKARLAADRIRRGIKGKTLSDSTQLVREDRDR